MREYPMLIGGEQVRGDGWTYTLAMSAFIADPAATFDLKSALDRGVLPTDELPDSVVGRCAVGDQRSHERAIDAAHAAKPGWGAAREATRHEFGVRAGLAIEARHQELLEILIAEGHPRRLAEWEIGKMIGSTSAPMMDFHFEQLRTEYRLGDQQIMLLRKPDGVVCLNPPQNTAGGASALGLGALVSGNTLIVKAPKSCPLSVMWLWCDVIAPILEDAGAPPGTLNVVCGDTRRILRQWIDHPKVDDIMFFGASRLGLRLGADCVAAGKKPILELAGNDCIVVWHDTDLDAATSAVCESFFGSTQICMVPKQVIVHPDVEQEVTALLLEKLSRIRPGYPEDPDVVLTPVLKAPQFFDFLSQAREQGAQLLCGGERLDVDGEPSASGIFISPTLVRVDGLQDARRFDCVDEETFFPLLPLIVPATRDDTLADQVIEYLNANKYGLRNSLWTADPLLIERFVSEVHNGGTLKVNRSHIGYVPLLSSFGGNAQTGGPFGELHYPVLRTTHLQGVAVAPHGTYTSQSLADEISLDGFPTIMPTLVRRGEPIRAADLGNTPADTDDSPLTPSRRFQPADPQSDERPGVDATTIHD